MALKTSLVFTGDASNAQSALKGLDKSLEEAAAEAARLSVAMDAADKAIEQLAAAQARAKQETIAAKVALQAGSISQAEYNSRLLETKAALSLFESGHRDAVNAMKQAQGVLAGAKVSSGQAAAGYQNFGRQVQDVAVQLQGGANLGTIISQQGGQIADAVAQMGGRFSGLASFLAGPWGAAVIVGTGLLVDLGVELYKSADAADANAKSLADVKLASNGLSDAQSVLGGMFDLVTGSIKAQNEMLRFNITLTALKLRSDASLERANAAKVNANFSQGSLGLSWGQKALGGLGVPVGGAMSREQQVRDIVSDLRGGKIDGTTALKRADRVDFSGLAVTKAEFLQAVVDGISAPGKETIADKIEKSLKTGLLDPGLRRPDDDRATRKRKGPADQTAARAEYGEDVAKRVANLADQFQDLPSAVTRANKAMRELDDISSDLATRPLTPNVEKLIAQVGRAKATIQESLNKPFEDFLEQSREAAEIDKLLLAGRDDEARALKIILDLKQKQGPLNRDQMNTVLATVQAERERAMVLRDQGELIAANVNAVRNFRGALEQTVADMFRGKFSLGRLLSSIGNSYINIMSQKIVEAMFGDTLRKLEAQATGADKVDAAGTRIAGSLDKGASAVESFADRINQSIARIEGGSTADGGGAISDVLGKVGDSISDTFDKLLSGVMEKVAQKSGGNGVPESTGEEIVVTAEKSKKVDLSGTGAMLINIVDQTMRRFGIIVPKVLTDSLKGVFGRLEQSLPNALQGALTGSAASKLILGNGGSSVGGAIGGAIGQKMGEKFLSAGLTKIGGKLLGSFAGPLGSVLGGVLGGAIGSLFKSVKTGYAVASNKGVQSGGSSAQLAANAKASGDNIQGALNSIADRLGATIGNYAVSIGMRSSGWIRVSASGSSDVAGKNFYKSPDAIYNGKDPEEALKVAIQNAIQDGAIQGVSAAVKKALGSSKDIDSALREAMKVADVELLIGGIGAQMEKSFRDFENQAKERLRIAKEYGFDLVKLEQRNADDRKKLAEQMFREQAGSLQDLIDELTSGSLFEGSAVDRRNLLLDQIAATRAKVNAGEEGAADKLAQLLRQFNEVSKEAYGTTGGFATDRATILDAAREATAATNKRIQDAQAASDPALQTTNSTLDEIADQNAKALREMGIHSEYLKGLLAAFSSGSGSNLSQLARTS
ncbi:MAG: phage tail length tape measure family protein [Novosphingobium sp.]|nr:phage tail length tape measure family protein [Novosphingobium sp.]